MVYVVGGLTESNKLSIIIDRLEEITTMKREKRRENLEIEPGIVTINETYQYFDNRDEMIKAAHEICREASYPEIVIDTWNHIGIDCSGYQMETVETKNVMWIPKDENKKDILRLYENIGAALHERSAYYTIDKPDSTSKKINELNVMIPDEWELFKSYFGNDMVSTPYGFDIELNNILSCVDGEPAFKVRKKDGTIVLVMLDKVIDE